MSFKNLSPDEQRQFDAMIADLHTIFDMDEILAENIQDILSNLKSEEVRNYINSLCQGAKPESALREAFFAGRSLLSKFLGGTATPEVNLGAGFVDYVLRVDGRFVLIELKSLFEPEFEAGKTRRIKKLKQHELRAEQNKEQVLKYFQQGSEYIILTDLKNWYLFNKQTTASDFKAFDNLDIFKLVEDYRVIGDFWDFLRRKDFQAIREILDKKFFESLKIWVSKLSEIEFEVEDKIKIEQVIRLLNKFIFIQTLDDFYVVDARWIKTNWDESERKWKAKGKYRVIEDYLDGLDIWFEDYYDTELFRENILKYVKNTPENIDKFYNSLQMILGVTGWQATFRGVAGIMQYNFRFIDEDIFGKAYETFLAEIRHDEGIYYTPRYITEYVVENTVGRRFDVILSDIQKELEKEEFEEVKKLVEKFISIRVLDPACGSGSFLIKAVRKIMEKYKKLIGMINETEAKYNRYEGTLRRSKDTEEKVTRILEIVKILKAQNGRELISRLLVRHIHGNDLDRKALEVAKVNIWLEAIKLSPADFRYNTLPMETNHILPDLEMNLTNGDTVVGLPEEEAIQYLTTNHKAELAQIYQLRNDYLQNPTNPQLVVKIEEIKNTLRNELNEQFKTYLTTHNLPIEIFDETKPLHWPLESWYLYMDKNGEALEDNDRGADIIIGNPPYERIQTLSRKAPVYVKYLSECGFVSSFMNYDLAVIFIERGYSLLNKKGEFGYIVVNKFMTIDYGEKLREFLISNKAVREIINFTDQQVFEKASTYTCLLFLNKNKNESIKYANVKQLARNLDQLMIVKENTEYNSPEMWIRLFETNAFSGKAWTFGTVDAEVIFEKLKKKPTFETIRQNIFQGMTTSSDQVYLLEFIEYQNGLVKVHSKANDKDYLLEKELLKPTLKGSDVTRRYLPPSFKYLMLFPYNIVNGKAKLISQKDLEANYRRIWQYLLDNKNILEARERGAMKGKDNWYGYIYKKNLEKFETSKILTQVLASSPRFALDEEGLYYFVGGGTAGIYGITLQSGNAFSLKFVCALLNSLLLEWYHRRIASLFRGGFHAYQKGTIDKLPLPELDTTQFNSIETLVDTILDLEKLKQLTMNIWNEWSEKLKDNEKTLNDILLDDKENIRSGKLDDELWTDSTSFYPNESNPILEKQFKDFKVKAIENEDSSLAIYGIDENNQEELIYIMSFHNQDLMIHTYICINNILDTKAKIKCLRQVLEKTKIPVIQPNITVNTINIIKKLNQELANRTTSQAPNIITIDKEIENTEAKINSIIFKLYNLTEIEKNTIISSLNIPSSYQEKISSN